MSHCFKLAYETHKDVVKRNKIKLKIAYNNKKYVYQTYTKTRIFGENFVKRNKNKFKIVYNNKEYALKEFFEEIDDKFKPGIKIKFKLRIFHNILNLSKIFLNCRGLLSMKDDSKVNK